MKNIEKLHTELKKYSNFDNPKNIDAFLDIANDLVLLQNPESLDILLSFFDENSEYGWVMTSLRKILECYSAEVYVEHVLKNIGYLTENALTYADEIVNSILNSEKHKVLFIKMIHLANKEKLYVLFKYMEKESPHHKQTIDALKKFLKGT